MSSSSNGNERPGRGIPGQIAKVARRVDGHDEDIRALKREVTARYLELAAAHRKLERLRRADRQDINALKQQLRQLRQQP